MLKDAIVEEVRRARQRQAAKWHYDLNAILADARKRQEESSHRVVSLAAKTKKTR